MFLNILTNVLILIGTFTRYNPGVMEEVYRNRLAMQHVKPCVECIGMIALIDHEHLGKKVWLQRPYFAVEGPFLVVDCARAVDYSGLAKRGIIGELDYETAVRWRTVDRPLRNITVLFNYKEPSEYDYGIGMKRV